MLLTVFAGVFVHMGLFHHKPGRDNFQTPGNILADVAHLSLALGAYTFLFRQGLMNDLNLDIFRQFFPGRTARLPWPCIPAH